MMSEIKNRPRVLQPQRSSHLLVQSTKINKKWNYFANQDRRLIKMQNTELSEKTFATYSEDSPPLFSPPLSSSPRQTVPEPALESWEELPGSSTTRSPFSSRSANYEVPYPR